MFTLAWICLILGYDHLIYTKRQQPKPVRNVSKCKKHKLRRRRYQEMSILRANWYSSVAKGDYRLVVKHLKCMHEISSCNICFTARAHRHLVSVWFYRRWIETCKNIGTKMGKILSSGKHTGWQREGQREQILLHVSFQQNKKMSSHTVRLSTFSNFNSTNNMSKSGETQFIIPGGSNLHGNTTIK